MSQVKVTVDKKAKTLTIVLPLQDAAPSASGKTMVIASSHGNQTTDATYDGNPVVVGVNAYYRR